RAAHTDREGARSRRKTMIGVIRSLIDHLSHEVLLDEVLAAAGHVQIDIDPVPDPALVVRARVSAGRAERAWYMERAVRLTPYDLANVVDDALFAGPEARVDVTAPRGTTADALAWLERRFGYL